MIDTAARMSKSFTGLVTQGHTAIDMRQMEHSEAWVEALSPSFLALPRFRSRWWVCLLQLLLVALERRRRVTHLKALRACCHPRLHSILILTHRKIISSPPRKSIPSWMMSPSLSLNGLLSWFGWLSRMWLRKVPDELLTSLIHHSPFLHHSSQCFRLTTFDLKPTAAAEGWSLGTSGSTSLSEYRPTLITADSSGRVRLMVEKEREGLAARGSWCMMKRIDGRSFMAGASFGVGWSAALGTMEGVAGMGPEWFLTVSCGAAVSARVRVMVGEGGEGSGCGCGCEAGAGAVWVREALGRALLRAGANGDEDEGNAGGVGVAARARALGWAGGEGGWRCPWCTLGAAVAGAGGWAWVVCEW